MRRTFLLLHGLTASPLQFADFGRLLFDRGANVFIPRLPHHGYRDRLTAALADLTADELRTFAASAYARAATLSEEVVVVGFSVGGLLAAWIGQHRPVARATAIAPFFGVNGLPPGLTRPVARAVLLAPNRFVWWDPRVRANLMPVHGYPRFPTHALAEAAQLGGEILADARRHGPAAADVQVILNARETAVSNAAARTLARSWSLHRSGAVLYRVQGLAASHDIIEPLRNSAMIARLYPALIALVDRG